MRRRQIVAQKTQMEKIDSTMDMLNDICSSSASGKTVSYYDRIYEEKTEKMKNEAIKEKKTRKKSQSRIYCEICNKPFFYRQSYTKHKRIHGNS